RREGGGGVDPKARVGVDAPHEDHVKHADQAHVLDERGFAAQEPRVLQPLVRLSEERAGHGTRSPADIVDPAGPERKRGGHPVTPRNSRPYSARVSQRDGSHRDNVRGKSTHTVLIWKCPVKPVRNNSETELRKTRRWPGKLESPTTCTPTGGDA